MKYFWLAVVLVAITAALGSSQASESGASARPAPDFDAYPWFFLRDGKPLTEDENVVELIAVGDVMLGRGVAKVDEPLAAVTPWLQTADLTFANLESMISEQKVSELAADGDPQPYELSAPVTAVAQAAAAGFDLLSLANNHSLDQGPDGLAETATRLLQAGITPVGAGPGEDAYRPIIRQVNGIRLAFLAFNAVSQPESSQQPAANVTEATDWRRAEWDEARATAAVAAARQEADVVLVSIHWGYEYELQADPSQETAAHALFAAGADLVIGHHPHVVQPLFVDHSAGKLVAYSLGNFVFDQEGAETSHGLALRVFFDHAGLRAVQGLPVRAGLRPRLMSTAEGALLFDRVHPPPPRLWFACQNDSCQIASAPLDYDHEPLLSGRFWSGAIDLTGDGKAEVIRRSGEQVTIYQGGAAVWHSPPDWRVVDAALGDPNNDGRSEIVLALWRLDAAGHERSQPYIVGYRGGEYKVLWGGRPVTAPLLEVEHGDVDGDGAQEVVVLEDQEDGQQIAVWRWQGWTFSQVWRSERGRYQSLVLLPGSDGRLRLTVSSIP